jgi:SpoVK/Ycf46/Vps4 family AAA+-type ATPase
MEDVDLVVGDRASGSGPALLEFLVALDGAMSDHTGVVTIATTHDPGSIDPAAKRSARFDVLIEVPPPDAAGREAILVRYLRDLTDDVDVPRLAAATNGMSGADLRELVSDSVLHTEADDVVDTELLIRLAVERRQRPAPGLYL